MDRPCEMSTRKLPPLNVLKSEGITDIRPGQWAIGKSCGRSFTQHSSIAQKHVPVAPENRVHGTELFWPRPKKPTPYKKREDAGAEYDCRDHCRICIEKGIDQNLCGNDWAISIVTVIGDVYALAHRLRSPPMLSAAFLTSSFSSRADACCDKVSLYDVASYLTSPNKIKNRPSLKLRSCWPETTITNFAKDGRNESVPHLGSGFKSDILDRCCWDCCDGNNRSNTRFQVQSMTPLFAISDNNIDIEESVINIKNSLMQHGPVCSSFIITPEFNTYWSEASGNEIWDPELSQYDLIKPVGQSIVITGYGLDSTNSRSYWIVRNSWYRERAGNYFGKIYMTRHLDASCALDVSLMSSNDRMIGGAWEITLPSNPVEGLSALGGKPTNMNLAHMRNINWLIPIVILVVGILLVVLEVVFIRS